MLLIREKAPILDISGGADGQDSHMPRPPDIPRPTLAGDDDPVVVLMTESLRLEAANGMADRIRRGTSPRPGGGGLTAGPAFDSDGTGELLALQAELGSDRLVVI